MCSDPRYPQTGTRTILDHDVQSFLKSNPNLQLGGNDFHSERSHHTKIFGFHALPTSKRATIASVEHVIVPGPHGSIPLRIFNPSSQTSGLCAALIYFHGGGYTIGTVDEFENGLRIIAEESSCKVIAVEYRLAPEWRFPTQLDEYVAVFEWLQGEGGKERGIDPNRILGGGDSAGGNMTAAVCLRLKDEGEKVLKGQVLLYPEARLPFDTPAAAENNTGFYLECNGIFSFANHYLPRGIPPSHPYVSPGTQPLESLRDLPPATIFTCGFDPLRDVGVEYGSKLKEAGNEVEWHHYDTLTHGFLQMAPWSNMAMEATKAVGREVKRLAG